MFFRRPSLDAYAPFAGLPVRRVAVGPAKARMAVHIAGRLDDRRLPVVCVPAYYRNMADYAAFVRRFQILTEDDWPVVLVDLLGRGRSSRRARAENYSTLNDAADLVAVCDALGIRRAGFVGQGHGGQVLMALAAQRQSLPAGAVLIDAGPITDTPGIVRMRDNLMQLSGMRREREFLATGRQIHGVAHPGATHAELDEIALRTHMIRKRGRPRELFDRALVKRLKDLAVDDVFEPQWQLFNALANAELMLVRTQFSDLLQRATFERMSETRSDAIQFVFPGQGTPPRLSEEDEVGAIADFILHVSRQARLDPVVAG